MCSSTLTTNNLTTQMQICSIITEVESSRRIGTSKQHTLEIHRAPNHLVESRQEHALEEIQSLSKPLSGRPPRCANSKKMNT